MKRLRNVFMAVTLLSLAVFAQTPTGNLVGTVSSPDGVLPGASVEIKFDVNGRTQTTTANSSGVFSFAQLEPGTYTVTVSAPGFKTLVANQVKIDIGREFNLSPTLEVGGVAETVTVTAGADIVTSTTGQLSTTISTQQILSFPLLTRSPLSLTTMQAGVQTSAYQNTTINGMRTSATNITRDGISINDPFIRSNATDFAPGRPSVDDTSEITIVTGVQESDSGGGAQIQVLTPRGTSDFHGALFAYNRNSHFAANNFFSNRSGVERPFRNRNQYGGKIGGPIPFPNFGDGDNSYWAKDKGFFFFSYEGMKDPLSQRYTRTILTPAARGGAFTFLRAAAGDPINSGGVSCPSGAAGSSCTISNVLTFAQGQGLANIPGTINPVIQSRVLDLMPTAGNFTGLGDGVNTTGFALNRAFNTTLDQYTARVDVDPTSKDSVSVIYSYNREDLLRPDVDDSGFTASPDVTQYSANLQLTAAYRRIFSSNIVNDFRWGRFTNEVPFDRISDYPDFYLSTGLSTTTGGALLGGLITNPINVFMDQGRENEVMTFADNVNWIIGDHSLRFGGLYQKYKVNSYNDFGIAPHYIIGNTSVSTATNTTLTNNNFANVGGTAGSSIINATQLGEVNGLLAILGGLVRAEQQAFNMQDIQTGYVNGTRQLAPFINWNHALYVSDRWQIRPGLTLNAGVRWEIYPALRIDNGLALEAVVDENNPAASLLAGNGAFNVVGTNAGKEYRFYKTDMNNFAPSVSIAWTPNFEKGIGNFFFGNESRTVIRAGYSHVYANDQIITALNNTITSAATGNVGLGRQSLSAIGPAGNTQLNLRAGDIQQIPTPAFTGANRTFLQNSGAAQGFFGNAGAIDPNLQIPMIKQYSFGIQRELPWNMAVEARYVGTSSNNLLRSSNLNEIDVVGNGFLADFQRAQANLALTGSTAFCNPATVTGCQALTLFRSGAIGSGPLVVGTALTAAAFNTQLRNGTVADLAHSFVSLNLNNHPTFANSNLTPFVKFYPNPNSGMITLMENDASYNYNSLQLELRRRFSDGILLGANYTWSKNLTNGQGTAQALNETYQQRNNKDLDYQRADFDIAHTFNFNGLYQFPFGKGRRWMNNNSWGNYLLGGWDISGILQMRSGVPITFTDGRGTLNRGTFSGRQTPNSSLTPAQIADLTGVFEANGKMYWIDPSILCANGTASGGYIHPSNANTVCTGQIFSSLQPGQTSGLPRAFIEGPGYWNVNAALMKNFLFTENMKLQLRMEAFNVFNNVNLQNNTQFAGITSTTFGQITSAAPARIMQFAARFEF
jgi:hypothetical protein